MSGEALAKEDGVAVDGLKEATSVQPSDKEAQDLAIESLRQELANLQGNLAFVRSDDAKTTLQEIAEQAKLDKTVADAKSAEESSDDPEREEFDRLQEQTPDKDVTVRPSKLKEMMEGYYTKDVSTEVEVLDRRDRHEGVSFKIITNDADGEKSYMVVHLGNFRDVEGEVFVNLSITDATGNVALNQSITHISEVYGQVEDKLARDAHISKYAVDEASLFNADAEDVSEALKRMHMQRMMAQMAIAANDIDQPAAEEAPALEEEQPAAVEPQPEEEKPAASAPGQPSGMA